MTEGTFDFDGCETTAEADCLYKQLFHEVGLDVSRPDPQTYQTLSDAHRRAHERFVVVRQGVEEENAWREAHGLPWVSKVTDTSLDDVNATASEVRAWALANGMDIPTTGKLHAAVIAEYAKVFGSTKKTSKKEIGKVTTTDTNYTASEETATAPTPSSSDVRTWALLNGIPVSKRGRVHPDVIAQYLATREG